MIASREEGEPVRIVVSESQEGAEAAGVAQAVADVSVGVPLRGTLNIAGPEVFALDELGRITLTARGDHRAVVTDDSAGMYAAASGSALVAKDGAVIARTTYREWLAR